MEENQELQDFLLTEPEEQRSQWTVKRPWSAERILGVIALCAAALLVISVVLALPYFNPGEDPQLEISRHPEQTAPIPETQSPTEGPTEPPLPQPEANPYGRMDFQYEGRYLGCIKADTIPGIDVSAYQGKIDWKQVKESGIGFAIIRLGYRGYETGKLVQDDYAIRNIQGALDAGVDVGIYFFSQAITPEEAAEEAQFILDRIKGYDITMPIVFDWEYVNDEARTAGLDRRTLTDCYLEFFRVIDEAGYTPMAYFNSYQSRHMMYLHELEEYPFWLALYSDRMTYPYRIDMWQYTCTGRVPGIQGDVDINVYFPEG